MIEQKKKSSNYIIPATFFTSLSPVPKKVKIDVPVAKPKAPTVQKVVSTPKLHEKPQLKNITRRPSAFSLKSIHQKKEAIQDTAEENYDNHPKTSFDQEKLKEVWKKYYFKLQDSGEKNIASIIASDTPLLKENFKIVLALPNTLMQSQLEKGKPALIKFLREKLNNYGITLTIVVNETIEKKFAYTPQEKYNKLKEKNPLLEKLKNTFGLDI